MHITIGGNHQLNHILLAYFQPYLNNRITAIVSKTGLAADDIYFDEIGLIKACENNRASYNS